MLHISVRSQKRSLNSVSLGSPNSFSHVKNSAATSAASPNMTWQLVFSGPFSIYSSFLILFLRNLKNRYHMYWNCSLIGKPLRVECEVEKEKLRECNKECVTLQQSVEASALPSAGITSLSVLRKNFTFPSVTHRGWLLLSFILHHQDSWEHLTKFTEQNTGFVSTEYGRVIKTPFPNQKHNSS